MKLDVIILAAGEGTRMRSALPKVLHRIGGIPLLQHVISTAEALDALAVRVVHGFGSQQVCSALSAAPVTWVLQHEQLGTGHAVQQAAAEIPDDHSVLVLYGDVPLIRPATLRRLLSCVAGEYLAVLTASLDNPSGYGRIIRDAAGNVISIVEEKDASEEQRQLNEINTGILAVPARYLHRWLARLENGNAAGEYYLTDIIAMAVNDGVKVKTTMPGSRDEIMGVNNRSQLAELERSYQQRQAQALMAAGVTVYDPARLDIRGELICGNDSSIDINVIVEGKVTIGRRATLGANTLLRNSTIADDVSIDANCVIDGADIGVNCRIGPFARIRPGTDLAAEVHIGNFVEIKKSRIAEGSKINHLSYVGDATVGSCVNVGAGTITCNYDGANKHPTDIGDNVFIGSDSQLIAPVKIGDGATIGAGSTITKDVPAGELVLSRVPQRVREGWKRPVKQKP